MTRINTNVSSLIAQTNLARSQGQLQTALTRLSTGLRINSGKDDPAGLIASQVLQSDITSTQGAITNSQQADQLISTADSALGQVSTLLNSIQALVTQSANTGALSTSQLQANQLQVDSSLDAIDRIAQTTSFGGQKLLDGSLDFITKGVNTSQIQNLQINQANFGTQTAIGAQVNVIKQATQGSLNYNLGALGSDATLQVSGANGSQVFQFAAGSSIENIASAVNLVSDATGVQAKVQTAATKGQLNISSFGANNDIALTANTAGQAAGNVQVKYSLGNSSGTTATYTAGVGSAPGTINVQLQTQAAANATATVNDPSAIDNSIDFKALQAGSDFNGVNVQYIDGNKLTAAGTSAGSESVSYNQNATDAQASVAFAAADHADHDIIIKSNTAGIASNGITVAVGTAGANGSGVTAAYDSTTNKITLNIAADVLGGTGTGGKVDTNDVITAINGITGGQFTASLDKSKDAGNDGTGLIADNDAATGTFDGGTNAKTLAIVIDSGTSTANQVISAVNSNAHIAALFSAVTHPDNAGTGAVTAGIYGHLAGGVDGSTQAKGSLAFTGANNDLLIKSNATGTTGNGVHLVVASGATAGAAYDSSSNTITLTVKSDNSTTANAAIALINGISGFSASLDTSVETGNTGLGTIAATDAGNVSGTLTGGAEGSVVATANDVVSAINASGAPVTAALSGTDNGFGVVTSFDKSASSGSVATNNALQFLGNDNAANIRFTSVAGQSLGVDTTTDPQVLGNSNTTLQDTNADATLTFTAQNKGTATDGVTVSYVADANVTAGNEFAVYDKNAKSLQIHIDNGVSTAANVANAVNNDKYVSQYFHASNFGNSDGSGKVTSTDTGTTSGGLVSSGTLIVKLATDSNGIVTTTANDLVNFFNNSANASVLSPYGISVSNAIGSNGTGVLAPTTSDVSFQGNGTTQTDSAAAGTTNAVNGTNAQLTITAATPGAASNGVKVVFQSATSLSGAYDAGSKTLTVNIVAGSTTASDVSNFINGDSTLSKLFTASLPGSGAGLIDTSDNGALSGGVTTTGTQQGVALQGNSDQADTGLTFTSTTYGSDSFVSVNALSGTFNLTDSTGAASDRSTGTDIQALVNGVRAIGQGLTARLATSALDLQFTLASSVTDGTSLNFSITGGGAQFQLGPQVVSNQQARLGISGVSTATLGGTAGNLFELHSGGDKSLTTNVGGAAAVLGQVIDDITSLRGRLGAFQSTTLETNINTLNDTLTNLTTAQSSIQDADFAAESANLTRAQILVQSGTSVLQLANQAPQQVLALLPRG